MSESLLDLMSSLVTFHPTLVALYELIADLLGTVATEEV